MVYENMILAAITINPQKVPGGMFVFHCHTKSEMEELAAKLEGILNALAHELTDEIFIIVKH